jgi:hypothetical protein
MLYSNVFIMFCSAVGGLHLYFAISAHANNSNRKSIVQSQINRSYVHIFIMDIIATTQESRTLQRLTVSLRNLDNLFRLCLSFNQ